MVTFNIRETGNELIRTLEKELKWSVDCRLTIDLLIPDVLTGDKDGLCTSILLICQFLDSKLRNFSVNIELSTATHSGESLDVSVEVKGVSNQREEMQLFLHTHRTEVEALLGKLSYPTTFSVGGSHVRFSFTLPFLEENSKIHRASISCKKVLLAEDDDLTALVLTSFMEEWGYIVTRVSDGVSALDEAIQRNYDIILMDTFMPKLSGADAIKKIRASNKKTPIVVLTTCPVDKEFTARYDGANGVIIKPVSGADLQRVLRRHS